MLGLYKDTHFCGYASGRCLPKHFCAMGGGGERGDVDTMSCDGEQVPPRTDTLGSYLPPGQAVRRLPVTSELDGRVLGEELMDVLHCNFTHVYVYGAL